MHLVERVSATLLWGMVALTVAVALLINNGQLRLTTMAGALLVVVLLLVGLGLAGFFLALVHRRWLGHWWAWLLIVGLCILGGASVSGTPLSKDANVALLMSLSLPLGTGSLLGALAVTFARYDIGGMAIAAITLIDVWGLYFIARAEQDIVESLLQFLETGSSRAVWAMNLLFVGSITIAILAGLSYIWHTIRLFLYALDAGRSSL